MEKLVENIATVAIGALTFTAMLVTWVSLRRQVTRSSRLRTVAYRDTLRSRAVQRRAKGPKPRTQLSPMQAVQRWVGNLKLVSEAQKEKTRQLMMQAGWRQRDGIALYVLLKLVGPVLGVAAAGGVVWSGALFQHSILLRVGAVIAGGLLGSVAVDLAIKSRISSRQKVVKKALPDVLDLLVICAETGLGFDVALGRVSQEFDGPAPAMADELSVLEAELTFLPDRRQAFENLAKRTGLTSVNSVVTTILQGERYGTPLSHSLRTLSAEFRTERLLAAEQKAARLPAIMTVPLILFILPCLFIVVIGPAILSVIDTFKHLH